MAFHQGRNSRKRKTRQLERQCSGQASHVPCLPEHYLPPFPWPGPASYWQRSHCSDTGTKPTQHITEYGITFSKQYKMCVLSLQTPRSYSPCSRSLLRQTSALCWQTPSWAAKCYSALHACQERQWFHSTGPKPSVTEVYKWVATGHVEGYSGFPYIRPLCCVFSGSELVLNLFKKKKKKIMLSLFSFTVGMKDILIFTKCFKYIIFSQSSCYFELLKYIFL